MKTGDCDPDGVWRIQSSEGELVGSPASCTCKLRVTMQLPCRHMFAVRGDAKMDLFCMDLAAECWSMSYLTGSQHEGIYFHRCVCGRQCST